LKVNKILNHLSLKLNRLDDKAGSKLCIDLLNNSSNLESLSLSSNSLGHMFCESLAEFLKLNRSIKILDISCNFIDDSNAATLKDSLEGNPNIIEIDVRNNQLSEETVEEIGEIITKNFLSSKSIPFKKLGEYAAGAAPTEAAKEEPATSAKKEESKPAEDAPSPSKVEDAE
jgi:Ran GTPase-activating protein (RanGAP) involved in mRNA processing and transport